MCQRIDLKAQWEASNIIAGAPDYNDYRTQYSDSFKLYVDIVQSMFSSYPTVLRVHNLMFFLVILLVFLAS